MKILLRPGRAATIALAAAVAGCHPALPEPNAAQVLNASQAEALHNINEAGALSFSGWTWSYELGANCLLRVVRSYQGTAAQVRDHQLRGSLVIVRRYLEGFGVAATAPGSSAADLFGTHLEPLAKSFAADLRTLGQNCLAQTGANDRQPAP